MPTVIRRLVPPAIVLAVTAWAVHSDLVTAVPTPRLRLVLHGVLVATFLFAWRLRSARTARATVILGLLTAWFSSGAGDEAWVRTGLLVSLLLPLDFAFTAWWRDASLGSRRSIFLFALLAAELALLRARMLDRLPVAPETMAAWWPTAALAVGLVVVLLRLALRPTPLAAGWLGALTALAMHLHTVRAMEAREGLALETVAVPQATVVWLLAAAVVLLLALVERAFGFAFEDTLTGLPGRRALDQRLREIGGRYVIAMVDIDHFKRVNDRHGHDVGDQALRWVARRLRRVAAGGVAFRYGGEEFALIFAGKSIQAVGPHLEALRESIAKEPFTLRAAGRPRKKPPVKKPSGKKPKTGGRAQARTLKLTVSMGAAARGGQVRTPEAVVQAADRALYRAKRAGRNRVVLAKS